MFAFSSAFQAVLAFGTFLTLIIYWIRWRMKKLKIFEELRIPGPPPHFVFGNILEIKKKGFLHCQEEWIKKYGQVVGYYHGLKPVLMIADKNILKRIFVKDFHLFSERPEIVPLRVHSVLDHFIPASQIMDSLLLNLKQEHWKRVRSRLSPVFSANKLKMMIPFVNKISEVTLSILEEKSKHNDTTDIYKLMQFLTLDVICAQAFAMNTDAQQEKDENQLFRSAKTVLDNSMNSKIFIFGLCFPEVSILGMSMIFLKMFFANGFSIPPVKITNLIGKVIEERRKHPELRKPDILQSLIDASESSEMTAPQEPEKTKDGDSVFRRNSCENADLLKSKVTLTDAEIKANAFVVFLAGFETTSSALAYTIYMIAKHPKYQDEIQKEIDQLLEENELNYYTINNLQLLERCIMESMRFYPPAVSTILRVSSEDVDFGYFWIPKGMEITVPVSYMHFSEDNWEEPKVFDPDRFLLERRTSNHLMNYWAFGNGPRNCIGTRLAHITAKVILTKMLQRFTFELPENPEEATLYVTVKSGTMVPDKVLVKVKERESYLQKKKDNT